VLFYTEDGDHIFLRNFGKKKLLDYTAHIQEDGILRRDVIVNT